MVNRVLINIAQLLYILNISYIELPHEVSLNLKI